jgi:hypothetical protein
MTPPAGGPGSTGGYRVPLARPRARRLPEKPKRSSGGWQVAGIFCILGGLLLFALGQWVLGKGTGWGLVAAPVLLVVTLTLLHRPLSRETSFDLRGIVLTSLGLRLILSYVRFYNPSDALVYNTEGARLAVSFRAFDFLHVDVGAAVPGTGGLRYITGVAHLFTDSSFFGTTMIFTFVAFWASWFFYRAFEIAVPSGTKSRYAKFIMLWPSALYWPSSIGKDAWMAVTIALAALGAAKLLTRARGGYLLIAIGLTGAAFVRPHVALLAFAAIAVAFLVGRRDQRHIPGTVSLSGVTKALGIVLLLIGGAVLAPKTAHFLKVEDLSPTGVSTALSQTQSKTGEGNSAFHPPNPNSPIGFPMALFTVFYRPLPGELHNASGLLASLEAFALLLITIAGWRRIVGAFRLLRSEAYVTLAIAYLVMFGYAFSAIANFGILARERVQALPFLFVPLSMPKWHRKPRKPPPARASVGRGPRLTLATPRRS